MTDRPQAAAARPPRVLVAGAASGTGEEAIRRAAATLQDTRMEVVYAGRPAAPSVLAGRALEEDVDVLAVVGPSPPPAALAAALEAAGLGAVGLATLDADAAPGRIVADVRRAAARAAAD